MSVRSGEGEKTWFRADRFFHINDKWFFFTRENTQEGPFFSKREAEMELMLYLRHANDDLYSRSSSH